MDPFALELGNNMLESLMPAYKVFIIVLEGYDNVNVQWLIDK